MRMKRSLITLCALALAGSVSSGAQTQGKRNLAPAHARLVQEVRHQLVMLANYSVFDNLEFEISGIDTVTLLGQVVRPSLKSDAESAVRSLEGVGKVINRIEVLPIAPSDDRIRIAAYRSVFSKPGLDLYGIRAVPPIHIIVKNGSITLVGTVASQMDKDLAGIAAKEVPGAFEVTNRLKVERQ